MLTLQDATNRALESRASLKAQAERISTAEGLKKQAGAIANPVFQFENQNLRPGQTYTRDVESYAYLTQPLDVLGKRGQRIAVAEQAIVRTQAEYEWARQQIVQSVKASYWTARGAQESRDLLKATVGNFQQIIDYNSSRLSVGAISEQDFLRVRLEGDRLQIAANLATIEANRARIELVRQMGQTDFSEFVLSDPLDAAPVALGATPIQQVLDQRIEIRVARAALAEAQASSRMQDVSARPDLSIIFGYKRSQLADSNSGTNTGLAGVQITVPITDRNQGNRAAADAETRRQTQMLAAAEAAVRADFNGALQEYEMRRSEVIQTLQPLREHARELSTIALGAYAQGGTDLLRLLDAERARLEGELAWVRGMVEYQQSISNLEAAEGVIR